MIKLCKFCGRQLNEGLENFCDSICKENDYFLNNQYRKYLINASKTRTFESGATRDSNQDKLDYEGFFSPLVIKKYAEYMHEHRKQSDDNLRESDNWQKGIPLNEYMKSDWRHFMDLWLIHRGYANMAREDIIKALCGILFNTSGYLHEYLKKEMNN
ncbi:MAG: hypothetical protein EPN88_13820 [Bacteroidetes bacterium]|nr:MAG: hypothetical protein EPN88_13820 [Bacteroidota bacterium]